MNIFYEMASRLGFYKDVKNCLLKGFTPCAVTGVSNIHKAQTAMALSRLSPCLVICDDEASAIRMTVDINEMAGEQLACVFPAKMLHLFLNHSQNLRFLLLIDAFPTKCAQEKKHYRALLL